jgi:virginiamycin B lyase
MVWAAGYFGNNIIMLDPDTGKVTEHKMPLKYGNPYDLWPDLDDNIWIENAVYNSLVKFDRKTEKFTYFPFPELSAHTPKLDRDKDGTFWFTLGRPSGLAAFKPRGNVQAGAGVTQ